MRIPIVRGVIDRRILVNFRIDPNVLARIVPAPFRPHVIAGYGMAGICLIRLRGLRPRWLPACLGIGSENAAHRIAVEWDEVGVTRQGVCIPRRDSSSYWNALAGGRLFPGVHHHSQFSVSETADQFSVEVSNADGTHVAFEGQICRDLPGSSVFESLSHASDFFSRGSLGYSATRRAGVLDGLELRTSNWEMVPLAMCRIESSYFTDQSIFSPGTVEFDCALLMQNITHEWHDLGTMSARVAAPCC